MSKKSLLKRTIEGADDKRKADLASEILEDFQNRRNQRRELELRWLLNINFMAGNQFVTATPKGIEEDEKDFYWREQGVFNHVTPIIETRLAKLGRVRPVMKVLPFSDDDKDLYVAKMSTAILKSAHGKLSIDALIAHATNWSEVTGTAFYKVVWNADGGERMPSGAREGDVEVRICSPFEIFPDNLTASSMRDLQSIIHARAFSVGEIKQSFGVSVEGQDLDLFTLENKGAKSSKHEGYALVIERYTIPNKQNPEGRLEIVAGDRLVFEGSLPYINRADGERGLPFVRQVTSETAGAFFGTSVLERVIPVQRAFNAIKNRKHEFISRLAMGVLAVEDGSVDVDNLEEYGLPPGKIVTYRQGSNPPMMMDMGRVPSELAYEEDRLLNEFTYISGVSEIMRNSQVPSSISSGVALQLLIEQDDTRLSVTAELIRNAIRQVSEHILRLYKQFSISKRMARIAGDSGVEVYFWTKSDIGGEDIVFVTENELNETPASKRNMVFELLKAGLLHDENGKLSNAMRAKVLDLLGYGLWEEAQDIASLHIKRAVLENTMLGDKKIEVKKIDDHDIHIREHTRHLLSLDFDDARTDNFYLHIEQHKQLVSQAQVEQAVLSVDGGKNG